MTFAASVRHLLLPAAVVVGLTLGACGAGDTLSVSARSSMSAQALSSVADGYARTWAADAFLVRADGFDLDASSRLSRQPGSRWEFHYASVRRSDTCVVIVPARGQVVRQQGPVTMTAFKPVRPGANWRIDSDRALQLAMTKGKVEVLGTIDQLSLAPLRWQGPGFRLAWVVTPTALPDAQPYVIDAASGETLRY